METTSQALIRQVKIIKKQKKISYNDIMDAIPTENGVPVLSLSTVKRVFAKGSENGNFNYETTLRPIAMAINHLGGVAYDPAKEIETLKEHIDRKDDEIFALKSHVQQLTAQIEEKDKLVTRLISRLDQKDEIIHQFILDLKEKDELIAHLAKGEKQ